MYLYDYLQQLNSKKHFETIRIYEIIEITYELTEILSLEKLSSF